MRLSGLASRLARPSRAIWGNAVRAGRLRRECLQAFARTDDHGGLLIVNGARVRMPGHAEVLVRSAPVLVTDVALADIAGHDEDFFGWPKKTCPAPRHAIPAHLPGTNRAEEILDIGIARRWVRQALRGRRRQPPDTTGGAWASTDKPKSHEPVFTLHELR